MPTPKPTRKSRWFFWASTAVGAVLWFYFLPLFHVVPLKAARQQSATTVFDAAAFVEKFWNERLLKSTDRAVEVGELLAAFRRDPVDAAKRYGHRLGLSGTTCYFVSGSGRVVAVDNRSVAIALKDGGPAEVVIETGPVFGNAIRDGSGLLDVSDFPNSQDFNALSTEINRRVEERVLPVLKQKAAVGAAVRFVVGAEIADAETDVPPVRIVPVVIEFP